MYRVIRILACCLLTALTQTYAAEWKQLDGCRLVPNESNDGDSFHVKHGGEEYIFRLYFVDCPESSMQVADRVAQQASEFGVAEDAVLKAGKEAGRFTEKALSTPFTVTIRFQNARGASKLPRSYATIRTAGGKDLATLLVEAGLARAHGATAAVPRAPSMSDYERMEARARRGGYGIFGGRRVAQGQSLEPEEPAEAPAKEPPREKVPVPDAAFPGRADPAPTAPVALQPEAPGVFPAGHQPIAGAPPAEESGGAQLLPSAGGKTISINTATQQELETLPMIGPKTAAAIIEARPFGSVQELHRVKGIGPGTFAAIAPLVTE